jgi:hypothetical protein
MTEEKEQTRPIALRVDESVADLVEDIMWEVNLTAKKKGVKHPRTTISDVIRSLIKSGIESKDKVKKELLDKELEKIEHGDQ